MSERIALAFPNSRLTGIDICKEPGRLYRGSRSLVRFLRQRPDELSETEAARYQLLIICDVLHHVPHADWPGFLASASRLMADGGTLILKDWVREPTPAYMFGYLSDRFITADRIRYPHQSELRSLARDVFGGEAIRSEFHVKPWHCNLALVISPETRPHRSKEAQG